MPIFYYQMTKDCFCHRAEIAFFYFYQSKFLINTLSRSKKMKINSKRHIRQIKNIEYTILSKFHECEL